LAFADDDNSALADVEAACSVGAVVDANVHSGRYDDTLVDDRVAQNRAATDVDTVEQDALVDL